MDSQFLRISYEDCLSRSKRVAWTLTDFESIELDFNRPFLPDALAQVRTLSALNSQERLWLNQIRGYTYAYLFRFIEEYIVRLIDTMNRDREDAIEKEALTRFVDEEIKHQRLFELFERRFVNSFPVPVKVIGNIDDVARAILNHSRLSVLILTSMLEWLTQAHYLAYFNREHEDDEIDAAYAQLFRLHWVEEAQHAYLDTLEIAREIHGMPLLEREDAIREFLGLCDDLFGILCAQAKLDLDSIQQMSNRRFDDICRTRVLFQQSSAYFDTFIRLGLLNRNFRKVIDQIAPGSGDLLDAYLAGHDDE